MSSADDRLKKNIIATSGVSIENSFKWVHIYKFIHIFSDVLYFADTYWQNWERMAQQKTKQNKNKQTNKQTKRKKEKKKTVFNHVNMSWCYKFNTNKKINK